MFVLDHRDSIEEELHTAEKNVKEFLKDEFNVLLSNKSFEGALLGHAEQSEPNKLFWAFFHGTR